ncbi:hypothetical protein WFJ45_23805, partial [Salmonella enterica subsp. enterica serovar Minnesota]|uniref:pilus assembly FimT family protein n=1 Tax=Salmonella enterica TaxID=28901 RepID=UPI003D2B70C7
MMTIVGLVATMAAPAYHGIHARLEVHTAASEIASTLRMARHLAMARRERLLLRFDVQARMISLRRADAGNVLHV